MYIQRFIRNAVATAHYELLDDGTVYAETSAFRGPWANADTLKECREQLASVLEDWINLVWEEEVGG